MNNLAKRVITAVILVVVLLLALFALPSPAAEGFFAIVLAVGAWEWAGFWRANGAWQRLLFVVALVGLAIAATGLIAPGPGRASILGLGLLYWLGALALMMSGRELARGWLIGLAGAIGLLVAWYSLELLLAAEAGALLFVWCAGLVAAADIGAYFTGKQLGRRKLAPTISPGKTIEGLAGGVVCAALAGALGAAYFSLPILAFAIAGAVIAGVSVVGDLWVSRFKRAAGLKDSGSILPGHGGVMDRIDSLIAALPLFVVALSLVGGGRP